MEKHTKTSHKKRDKVPRPVPSEQKRVADGGDAEQGDEDGIGCCGRVIFVVCEGC